MPQFQITTAASVKAKRDLTGTGLDAVIARLIDSVSQMARDYMGRELLAASYTEVLPLRARRRYVTLKAFPLTSVTSVKYASSRDFTNVTAMDAAGYQVLLPQGQIYLAGLSTWFEPGFLQIVYAGGMAADTTAFMAAFPRISVAADDEVIARLNRRLVPDGSPQALGSSVAYQDELKPLTDFYAALDPHRRLRL